MQRMAFFSICPPIPAARSRLLLIPLLLALSVPGPSAAEGCRRLSLEPKPRWAPAAIQSHDGAELLIADALEGSILRYDRRTGRHLGSVVQPGAGELEFNKVGGLQSAGEGYLLRKKASALVWLDGTFTPRRAVTVPDEALEEGGRGVMVWDYLVAGDQLYVYGDLEGTSKGARSWWTGYFRSDLEALHETERLLPAPAEPAARELTRLSGPLFAEAGGEVFALVYGAETSIVRLTAPDDGPPDEAAGDLSPKARLTTFPEAFSKLPRLPPSQGLSNIVIRFRALEQSTLATALYGWGEDLFVLLRQHPKDRPRWLLARIDPARDRLEKLLPLPTGADHLLLAPGANSWILLEKGKLRDAAPTQDISHVVSLPASWLLGESSPLEGRKSEALLALCEPDLGEAR